MEWRLVIQVNICESVCVCIKMHVRKSDSKEPEREIHEALQVIVIF